AVTAHLARWWQSGAPDGGGGGTCRCGYRLPPPAGPAQSAGAPGGAVAVTPDRYGPVADSGYAGPFRWRAVRGVPGLDVSARGGRAAGLPVRLPRRCRTSERGGTRSDASSRAGHDRTGQRVPVVASIRIHQVPDRAPARCSG